jgi:putative Mg2+ transporter-C (MgtC) family protein
LTEFLVRLGLDPVYVEAFRLDTLSRLLLAAVLGGIVGTEREISGKPAGLRTNLLICVGAALITELSAEVAATASGDPGRLAAQIVSGIGFIGAGTIIQSRGRVVGLTTAATLWVVAAIGMAVGAGAYIEAAGTASLVVITLFGLRKLERVFAQAWVKRRYRVFLGQPEKSIDALLESLRGQGFKVQVEGVDRRSDGLEVLVRLDGSAGKHDALLPRLLALDGVRRVLRG